MDDWSWAVTRPDPITYTRYDDNGNVVLTAANSAFVQYNGAYYSGSYSDLVNYASGNSPYLSDTAGLFTVTTYYASNTATASQAGGVTDWAYQTAVAQGETQARIAIGQSGGPILQTSTDYIADTVNGTTSYFTNSSTQYRDTSGLVPETTSYCYTFYPAAQSNGATINTETTTLPVVSTGQHGSGSPNSSIDVYDTYGRIVWSKDAAGSNAFVRRTMAPSLRSQQSPRRFPYDRKNLQVP